MEFQGKITNAKFRSGRNELSGKEWQACDYYVVETGQKYNSEVSFTMFNDLMLNYALHEGAVGTFDIQIYNEQRNGFNNLRVRLNGFKGIDNGQEKCVGVYAAASATNTAGVGTEASADKSNEPFNPNSSDIQAKEEDKLPF